VIVEIDHILVAVPDPDAEASRLAEALGLRLAGGGTHPAIGTRNALLSLGGPYLELIGLLDGPGEAPGRLPPHPIGDAVRAALRDGGAGAYVAVALRSDDLAADVARLRAGGSRLAPDVVRRARPDGSAISWPVAFPPRLGPDDPPFLIQHAPDEPERGARLAGAGPRLARLVIRVGDPAAVADAWAATLGIRFAAAGPGGEAPPDAAGMPGTGRAPGTGGAPGDELVASIGAHVVALVPAARGGGAEATIELVGGRPGASPELVGGPAGVSPEVVGSVRFVLA